MNFSGLKPHELYRHCDLEGLAFSTTDDFDERVQSTRFIGQPRAEEALHFGIGIQREGYNVFAFGEDGAGKHSYIRQYLERRAVKEKMPADICYINNFEERHKPHILLLKPGQGRELAQDMKELVENIRNGLRAAFENEEYQNRSQALAQEFHEKQKEAFEELKRKAREHKMIAIRTPGGLAFAPAKDDENEAMSPEQFDELSEEERRQIESKAEELQMEAHRLGQKMPLWQREIAEKQKRFNQEVTEYTIDPMINELKEKYAEHETVAEYLSSVRNDMIENVRSLFMGEEQQARRQQIQQMMAMQGIQGGPSMDGESAVRRRYEINVLVDNSKCKGAPVVYEENPTYQNLFGRVEHMAQMGALITDFNMIRAGAVHRANGGYLVLDALKVLRDPFAWEGLKRTLRSGKVKIESIGQMYSLISTVSLEPEALPLKVKVVMTGIPQVYYLLRQYDPEFGKLFKVPADFANSMDRNRENQHEYARMVAAAVHSEGLRPFTRDAVARVIERSSRRVGDAAKMSLHMQTMTDLLREADYWAAQKEKARVDAEDVQKAVDARIYRSDRLREQIQEQIRRDIVMIDTEGARVGQINGLAIYSLGDNFFGRPSRITARVRLGKGEVVDIEREVAMGGPIHSKGVLILSGFLGGRYAVENPLSLSASLVFEQSYGGVEGDSASSAELYALLSAISEVPIKQSMAVTGSVDQYGRVQPIGGVNEKIEGFFDVCREKGLNGEQGVLIPASNVQHLMLRQDVIDAVRDERFHVFAVETIDEGIEILTGLSAGEPDEHGKYPEESINGKVHKRLADLAEMRRRFARTGSENKER